MAVAARGGQVAGVIGHADRGSQYASRSTSSWYVP
jgi:transposase InsO family protein